MTNSTTEKTMDQVKVGDGVSHTIWTDRNAGTVVARTAKTVTVQRDKATRVMPENPSEHFFTTGRQEYTFERDPEGTVTKFSKRSWVERGVECSMWKVVGQASNSAGGTLHVGRREFVDFGF